MKYRPRKKATVTSRAKPHNIGVRAVPLETPDYTKLAKALIHMPQDEFDELVARMAAHHPTRPADPGHEAN